MRKRRLRGGITALSVLAAIGMASGITAFAADDTQSEAVDTGKGLEYVYESSGSTPSGVTLNGNSVIIKQSPNSTDSEQLFNIYNDKDRDGSLMRARKLSHWMEARTYNMAIYMESIMVRAVRRSP